MGNFYDLAQLRGDLLRKAQVRIADLEAVVDHLEQDNLYLIDEVRELRAELDRRVGESWRPHR